MKQTLWPECVEGKRGMYCAKCGIVVYTRRYHEAVRLNCPRCNSNEWYYIFDTWQPRARYGSVPYRVCVECATVVYGELERCPVCGGRLAYEGIGTNLGPEGKKGNSTR